MLFSKLMDVGVNSRTEGVYTAPVKVEESFFYKILTAERVGKKGTLTLDVLVL